MIPLKNEYKRDGLVRRVVSRHGDFAIAAVYSPEGMRVRYDVIGIASEPETGNRCLCRVHGEYETHDAAVVKVHELLVAQQRAKGKELTP